MSATRNKFSPEFRDRAVRMVDEHRGLRQTGAVQLAMARESVHDLTLLIAKVTGFTGKIVFDASKSDGAMRKLMDLKRFASMGWQPTVGLLQGIQDT